jgi:hypothetical protein
LSLGLGRDHARNGHGGDGDNLQKSVFHSIHLGYIVLGVDKARDPI